jgi:hypothetical protein
MLCFGEFAWWGLWSVRFIANVAIRDICNNLFAISVYLYQLMQLDKFIEIIVMSIL